LVKNIRLGTMSLPNAVYLRREKVEMENAQFNTMLCKGKMNFARGRKNGGEPRARFPPRRPESSGEGSGQNGTTVPQVELGSTKRRRLFPIRNSRKSLFRSLFRSWFRSLFRSFRGDGGDCDCASVQDACHGGILASLLVEGGEGCLVGGIQSIKLIANDQ